MKKAVFIDRDGTIIEDKGYVYKIKDFRLLPNTVRGLKLLQGYALFIVTNQSGIGRKIYSKEDLNEFNNYLLKKLKKNNIKIKKVYYCVHKPEDNCKCRKPNIKFLKDAEKEFGINLKKSFVIGDMKSDFEMGKRACCKTIHVLSGHGIKFKDEVKPNYFAKDLFDAAKWIIKNDKFR